MGHAANIAVTRVSLVVQGKSRYRGDPAVTGIGGVFRDHISVTPGEARRDESIGA